MLTETTAANATLIVIDLSMSNTIRFFTFPETPRESTEEIGDWYIEWLLRHCGFSGQNRVFALRFFDQNRTLRFWEHWMTFSDKVCTDTGTREIPFGERVAFC